MENLDKSLRAFETFLNRSDDNAREKASLLVSTFVDFLMGQIAGPVAAPPPTYGSSTATIATCPHCGSQLSVTLA